MKHTLGKFETGGKAAAPAFIGFMKEFLKGTSVLDFNIPDGVSPLRVNLKTGRLASQTNEEAFVEYFKTGTEPRSYHQEVHIPQDYLTSDEF